MPTPTTAIPPAGYLSLAYFGDAELSPATLAVLQAGRWRLACLTPGCPGTLLVDVVAGSPLSGTGRIEGVCDRCGRVGFRNEQLPSGTIGHLGVAAANLLRIELFDGNVELAPEEG